MGFVKNKEFDLKRIKTLGIDQSFTHSGLTVLDKEGVILECKGISTKPDISLEERIDLIIQEILVTVKKHSIRQVVIEGMSFSSRQSSGRQLGGLFYVILHELNKLNVAYHIVPPLSLKKKVTNSGKATKTEMINCIDTLDQLIMSEKSGIKIQAKKFEDLADSYWLAKIPHL